MSARDSCEDLVLESWIEGYRLGRRREAQRLLVEVSPYEELQDLTDELRAQARAGASDRDAVAEDVSPELLEQNEDCRVAHCKGRAAAEDEVRGEWRKALLERGFILTEDGQVAALECVDMLLRWYRRSASDRVVANLPLEDCDDASFCLEAMEASRQPLPVSQMEAAEWVGRGPSGVLSMIARKMKRRGALVAMAGVVTTAVTVGLWQGGAPQSAGRMILANETLSVAPWANLSGFDRQFWDAVDTWVRYHEERNDQATIAQACLALMSMPVQGSDSLDMTKARVIEYFAITRRHQYVQTFQPLFEANDRGGEYTHWVAMLVIKRASTDGTTVTIDPALRTAMLAWQASSHEATSDQRAWMQSWLSPL